MKLTPKEEEQRIATIIQLNPEFIQEMKLCASAVEMSFEAFLEILHCAVEDEDYYESMGGNESYRDYNWDKIWVGYELLTGKKVPPSRWGGPRVPFSCAC
jgi:hypothetical protein